MRRKEKRKKRRQRKRGGEGRRGGHGQTQILMHCWREGKTTQAFCKRKGFLTIMTTCAINSTSGTGPKRTGGFSK